MKFVLALLTTALPALVSGSACSEVYETLVDDFVKDNFDVKLMEGTFYELAYHDYTQPRNLCGCERSVKTIDTATEPVSINDLFTLKCPAGANGKDQITHLFFNTTESPGVLSGKCSFFEPLSGDDVCPDYLIDVGTREVGAPYPWLLELQCVERKNGDLLFAGINFYAKDKSNETLTEMMASAESHGLAQFIDGGFPSGLEIVDHTDCTYPDEDA
ncbi:hypothetical protein TrLO_g2778 [Triparma laevis f. longispina]|uniref:Uncharacterized protein n=1 Tax=Triparma laevis f. longispina TaxID=1714387 RepID=A0A9W7FU49_9STRA|nr:hypothetical protein TrLO_g2778 [Triparma laevis f. longispina]